MPSLPPPSSTPKPPPPSHPIATSITVATSTSPRDPTHEASQFSSLNAQASQRALATASLPILTLRLSLVEDLSAPSSPLSALRAARPLLDRASWADLLEERHSLGLCPYPTCGKAAGVGYDPTGEGSALKVRLGRGSLVDAKSGRKAAWGAYCSARCRARSEWFAGVVGGEEGEMLEDVEERRRGVGRGTEELRKETAEREGRDQRSSTTAVGEAADRLPTRELRIVERETPLGEEPLAPNIATRTDFERPTTSTTSPLSLSRPPRTPSSVGSAGSSLLPFNSASLAKTVLRATSSRPYPSSRPQPTTGLNGLPPPKWTSGPVMLDDQGREIEWADEGEETEEVRRMIEEGLDLRREMRDRGEM